MNRKNFIKSLGFAGVGMSLPLSARNTKTNKINLLPPNSCILIPSETAGPFPLDLTENSTFFRQDIRENEAGVQLNLKLKIIGQDNCEPIPNARVNIWHCDKDGVYSGYSTGNNPGDANATHLRGYQFTDVNGEVEFITIFPGWYNGRICHIHFQVYVSSSYSAISQLTFPIDAKNSLYTENSSLYTKGSDPLSFAQDNIFSDSHEYQLATLEEDASTGIYSSYMEVTVQGSGVTGIGHIERETAKVFELGQNYPNPYRDKTIIPFTLKQASEIKLEIWDLSGRKMATIINEKRDTGEYQVEVNPSELGLSNGNYIYQLEANNGKGIFRLPKMMSFQS
jgi:protocatechuate 3,4-dioxygenase beta subunit